MSAAQHTPGPWEAIEGSDYLSDVSGSHASIQQPEDGYVIAVCVGDVAELDALANAHRIVQCVNAHDALVAAVLAVQADPVIQGMSARIANQARDDGRPDPLALIAAIAKATGSPA